MTDYISEIIQRSNEAAEFVKGQTNALLTPFVFDLGSAGSQEIILQGNFIYAVNASDASANVDVQLNRQSNEIPKLNLTKNLGYQHPFMKVFVSWAAQPGKTFTLLFGQQAGELISVIDNRSATDANALLGDIKTNTADAEVLLADIKTTTSFPFVLPGAQIHKNGSVSNGVATLYTVPAGKTLFITQASIGSTLSAPTSINIFVTDAADNILFYIEAFYFGASNPFVSSSFQIPIRVEAGQKVKVGSSPNATTANASIHGQEV